MSENQTNVVKSAENQKKEESLKVIILKGIFGSNITKTLVISCGVAIFNVIINALNASLARKVITLKKENTDYEQYIAQMKREKKNKNMAKFKTWLKNNREVK